MNKNTPAMMPLAANWALTVRCNFSCSHCYSRTDNSPELALEEIKVIIDKLVRSRVLFVNFGGGEPLLRKDLFEIANYAKRRGLHISMNSNGSLITKAAAKNIKESGFRQVGISMDSHLSGIHDKFRNAPGSHKKAIAAIGRLKKAGIEVSVSSVICKINHTNFEKIIALAKKLKVNKINLHNYKCGGREFADRDNLDLSPEEWRDFYGKVLEIKSREKEMDISLDDPIIASLKNTENKSLVQGSICGKLSFYIKSNGDMTPCGFIPTKIGNILTDSFKEAWESSPILHTMRNKEPKGKCKKCKFFTSCVGGCTARAYAVSGDFNAPDPHCWYEPKN